MKNLIITLLFCFLSISCMAQKTIKTANDYKGESLSYVSSETFNHLKIYGNVEVKTILEAKSIEDVTQLLGQPKEIKNETDTAIDGTVLFERKLIIYPGLIFVFPKKEGEYKLSRIDYTSSQASLEIGDKSIKIGMNINDMSDLLPSTGGAEAKGRYKIFVENGRSSDKIKTGQDHGKVDFSDKSIDIKYNPKTNQIEKISILMYTI